MGSEPASISLGLGFLTIIVFILVIAVLVHFF